MYNYKAHVDRVVDGDTIDVTLDLGFDVHIKQRLRLFGVDTPETRTRNLKEKKAGLKSKKYVIDAIADKDIQITTEEKGKFGRYLAMIYYGTDFKQNLNRELVDKGLATEYFGEKKKVWPK